MHGTNCAELAPVPMTATRRPLNSTEWSQAAEWNEGPANRSRPAMAGKDGRLSWPVAQTSASKCSVCSRIAASAFTPLSEVRTVSSQPRSSSNLASLTSAWKRMHPPSSNSLATFWR